jgi:hypothetical protein
MKLFLVTIFAFCTFCYASLSIVADENIQSYKGEYVAYINLVFNDYVKTVVVPSDRYPKLHSDIRFYEFVVEEQIDTVKIRIGYNHTLIRKVFNVQIKDGGANYQIIKKTLALTKETSRK